MMYDVYGIGNALLDMEFDVSDAFLKRMDIQKGVMTYVDHARQEHLIAEIGKSNIRNIASGGSAANTMAAICFFGGKAFYSCKIANDETGQHYHEEMRSIGLHSNFDHMPKPTGETGRCLVKVTPDSDRTMNTHLGISVTLSEAEVHYEALKQAQYFYIEGYLMSSPSARAAVYKAKNYAKLNGVKTAVSLSDPFMVVQFKDAFDELLKDGVDLIFANEEEAFDYAGTQDLAKAIEKLQKVAQQFVITRGARGSVLFDGIDLHDIPAYPAKPIDTLGAGDMYAGAFLYGVTHGMNELEAAQLASMTAAHVVTQYGPRINATDAKRLLTQFQTEAA